jgi:hypothetical protein
MKIHENDIIFFDDKQYLVIDIIDNRYLYLINNSSIENDTAIVKIINKYNNFNINYIDNDDEFNYVLYKIYLNHKNNILNYFE